MGTGFKGGSSHFHSIGENVPALRSRFDLNENTGYFGSPGRSSDKSIRNIGADDAVTVAMEFYDTAAYGGVEKNLPNGKGVYTEMRDGSVLTFRVASSSDGSPAVSINISSNSTDNGGIKTQKIHFVQTRRDQDDSH